MTSFAVFFDSGVEVLSNSNYDVWFALNEITVQSLKQNLGFFIVVGWWGSLSLLGMICWICDRTKMKKEFLVYLAKTLECSFAKKNESTNSRALNISADQIHTTQLGREIKNKSSTRNQQVSRRNHRQVTPDSTLFVDVKKSISSFKDSKSNLNSIASLIRARKQRKIQRSTCRRILNKMETSALTESEGCCQCCLCCRSVRHELESNNLLINLILKTSPLYSRCERLTIFYFGILFDISICALFFNLDPQETEDYKFWENLTENFWVGLYSVLLSIPFTLLLSLGFHLSPKILSRLRQTKSIQQLKQSYSEVKTKLRCWKYVGACIFFVLSCLLSLYIIAFGEVAGSSVKRNWITSSGSSLLIDLLVFEIVPALFYGAIVSLVFGCDCKCWLCLVLSLELYRSFRNLAA